MFKVFCCLLGYFIKNCKKNRIYIDMPFFRDLKNLVN